MNATDVLCSYECFVDSAGTFQRFLKLFATGWCHAPHRFSLPTMNTFSVSQGASFATKFALRLSVKPGLCDLHLYALQHQPFVKMTGSY
jgi:hypothetical protein